MIEKGELYRYPGIAIASELDMNKLSPSSRKLMVFREETNTRKTLFLTLITTFGLKSSELPIS